MIKQFRSTTPRERLIFYYLDKMKSLGGVDMYGLIPDMQREFRLGSEKAKWLLALWKTNYNTKGNYKLIQTLK